MNAEMRALAVVVLGLIAIGAVVWQIHLFNGDIRRRRLLPVRLVVPLVVGGVILVGFFIHGLFLVFDPAHPEASITLVGWQLLKAALLTLALLLKSYFGPTWVGISAGAAAYRWFEHGQWELWAFLDPLLDWVFDGTVHWLKVAYLTLTTLYVLGASVYEDWITE